MESSYRVRLKSFESSLSKKEKMIASYISSHSRAASQMTINEMAQTLGMADSTIFKFTRKLGYSGFKDFHNALISEEFDPAISIHENISDTSSPLGVAVSVFNSSIDSLSHTKEMLESENLEGAVSLIVSSKTVFLFGLGGSNIIAADAYHKLLRSPLNVKYTSDYHLQLMEASRATKDDCAIIFSHTGRCKEAIQLADLFQQIGGRVLVITSDRNSPLARRADVTLLTISEETSFRSESLASRIVQLALIDSLYTSVMLANPRKSKNSLQSIRDAIELTR